MPSLPLTSKALFTPWNYAWPLLPNGQTSCTLSGGSWLASSGLDTIGPLSNLQTTLLCEMARSTDLNPASTTFDITLDKQRMNQLFALVGHNMTSSAQVRVSGYYDAARSLPYPKADSGKVDAWPPYAPISMLGPEDPNWLTGRPTMENFDRLPKHWFYVFPMPHNVQYWRIEIFDTANTDGHIDIGQLFVSPIVQLQVNFVFDSIFGWATTTTGTRSKGGAMFFDAQPQYRTCSLQLPHTTKEEAYYALDEMIRRLGKDRELFVSLFPFDLQYRQKFSFRAYFNVDSDLPRMTFKNSLRQAFQFDLMEAL